MKDQVPLNSYCREKGIKFVSADVNGVFAYVFNDFGANFEVIDKNGEECLELFIQSISNEENGLVQLLPGLKHNLEDGDSVVIYNVQGMVIDENQIIDKSIKEKGINGLVYKVEVVNAGSFKIGDTRHFTHYQRQGLCKQLKIPANIAFQDL